MPQTHQAGPIDPRAADNTPGEIQKPEQPTFKTCAQQFIKSKSAAWSNPKHTAQLTATLSTYAFPVIGEMPVDEIGLDEVLVVLEPICLDKNETATRVRGRIENILSWATVKKYRKPPNPAIWRGNLDMVLPKPTKVQKVRHHPALPYRELPEFMADLSSRKFITAKMLELCILTTTRTGELIPGFGGRTTPMVAMRMRC